MLQVSLLSVLVVTALGLIAVGVALENPQVRQANFRIIVGGQPTTIESYPYQLSLEFQGSHDCGASIIGANVALTAAHCTDGRTADMLSVRAATTYTDHGGQVVKVLNISQHPNYKYPAQDYDISVLHLAQNINLGPSAQITKLATQDQNIPVGTECFVSGWGSLTEVESYPNQLQVVTVPIISTASCKEANQKIAIVTPRMICAGYTVSGKDACTGDSGGPLVADGVQIGVVSWGQGCARPEYPGVYSSIPKLRSFIKEVSGI